MKIAVFSDTHGDIDELTKILNEESDIDLIIHLGDYSKDTKRIKEVTNIELVNIKGNCDINDLTLESEKIIEINKVKIFMTHGHKYGVKSGIDRIYYRAKELNVNIVLFGHSHIPLNLVEDNILFLNPGSISLPRSGYKKSYGIVEISDISDISEGIKSKIINV